MPGPKKRHEKPSPIAKGAKKKGVRFFGGDDVPPVESTHRYDPDKEYNPKRYDKPKKLDTPKGILKQKQDAPKQPPKGRGRAGARADLPHKKL